MLKWAPRSPSPPVGKREVNVMNTTAVVVEGRVQPDGRLEVSQKVKLPPGPVQVTVRPVAEPVQPDRFWKMMESIWADQRTSGRVPRTQEEIDAEIVALRSEAEEEMQAVERLQDECRRAREQAQGAGEQPH
jgi:hypothetical protein